MSDPSNDEPGDDHGIVEADTSDTWLTRRARVLRAARERGEWGEAIDIDDPLITPEDREKLNAARASSAERLRLASKP
jgi:hypothetical protein